MVGEERRTRVVGGGSPCVTALDGNGGGFMDAVERIPLACLLSTHVKRFY